MSIRSIAVALLLLVAMAGTVPGQEPEKPRDIGLVERSERGLAQIDVTLIGPPERLAAVTAADLELIVGNRFIESFTLDRSCPDPGSMPAAPPSPPEKPSETPSESVDSPPPSLVRVPTTFLFYFDQHNLTQLGRVNALDQAREMISELIVDGNRGVLVSSGQVLTTVVELTEDRQALLDGIDRMEHDRQQWVMYPWQEESRIEEVIDAVRDNSQRWGCAVARRLQREEAFNTEKALRLFAMTLGHMADLDPPKAAVFFADTVRKDAGRHYLGYIGERACNLKGDSAAALSLFDAGHALDHVVQQAAAYGTRLYTVQPEGLQTQSSRIPALSPSSNLTANTQRFGAAKDTLVGLSLETGGKAFINGVSAKRMIARIREDLRCPYLISFNRGDLPLDSPLAVNVRVKMDGVKARARGQIVLQSDGKRLTSRLLAAFAAPKSVRTDATAHGVVVPTGFADGRYRGLVQISLPASPLPNASWDIGASLVSRGEFKEDDSRRVQVERAGIPLVYEQEMEFRPGPYEIIAVAHETGTDRLATVRLRGEWPERSDGAALGPVALMQPANALFVLDDETRGDGALGRDEQELVRTELPAAMIGLVCRGRGKGKKLRVERSLAGDSAVRFPEFDLDFGDDRCVQIQDLIPAATMTSGSFQYRVRLLDGDEEIDQLEHKFIAADETDRIGSGLGG